MVFRSIFLFGILNILCSYAQKKDILKITTTFEEKDAITGLPYYENTKSYETKYRYWSSNNLKSRELYFFQNSDTSKIIQTSELSFVYDTKGNILVKTSFYDNSNSIVKNVEKFKYNSSGKVIRREEKSYFGNAPSVWKYHTIQNYTYNTLNDIVFKLDSSLIFQETEINNPNVWQVLGQIYEYDLQNRLVKTGYTSNLSETDYTPTLINIYKTSESNDTLISKYFYQGQSTQTDTIVRTKITDGVIEKNSGMFGFTSKTFNKNMQLIEQYKNSTYLTEERLRYTYNEKGKIEKEYYYQNDTLIGYAHKGVYEVETIYLYDKNDSLINKTATGWFKVNYSGRPFRRFNFIQKTNYEYITENTSKEISAADDVILFPNPATEWVEISNTLGVECIKNVKIINEKGARVFEKNFARFYNDQINGTCTERIQLSFLPKGVYLVVMDAGNEKYVTKRLLKDK